MATTVVLMASARPRRGVPGSPQAAKQWRAHAHRAGEIVMAWNDLQAGCFQIFETLTDRRVEGNIELPSVAYGIWHTIQSDNTQREMMLAAAKAVLGTDSKAYLQVKWLKDKADDMAKFRNDPAHTPIGLIIINANQMIVGPNVFFGRPQAIQRLTENPLGKTWRKIRGDLLALARFSGYLSFALTNLEQYSLPHKPRLLTVPTSHPKKRQRRRDHGKPPSPPQSSPA